ncbi:hypothetical protein ALC57_01250 [Trachymyrmex cornetzi]|uniref:Mutator-like transposase domain-containing protein n=1 Tax=Trachymyrmex cornetzi TaxID=471704 RepID=A0A151JQC2_9HYME|nr:hypothetical protein ALC57_01250 [Trachymyrmex cornetzi]
MEDEIKNLAPTQYKNITVNYEMLFTMIEGKVCTALSNETSYATCPICGARPSQMNAIVELLNRDVNKSIYNFGISSLHAKIHCMEFLLYVSYNMPFKKWSVCDPVHKKQRQITKEKIQKGFKKELGLLIDIVKNGSGLSNDGNTARRFFATTHAENCQSNHNGSAGKMEVDGILEMFQRSIKLHDVKYMNYIGDGDSTTLIDELTIYYGLSIRRNANSVENMKKEIWATLYHKLSTDENPQHGNCPQGANSWCSWQKACAENLNSYKHKPALPIEVFNAIKPRYEDLSRDDLLERLFGWIHSKILWNIAPKNVSSGKKVLDIAMDVAVCTFNDGLSAVMKIMEVLQFTIGSNCYNFCVEADAARIRLAEVQMSDAIKEARSASKSTKKAGEYENTNTEGQLYGAGIAD